MTDEADKFRVNKKIVSVFVIIILISLMLALLETNLTETREPIMDNNPILGIFKPGFLSIFLRHTIAYTTPIFLAALGGLYSERSGVINLALEGMMLSGAFTGVLIAYFANDAIVGFVCGVVIGGILGLLHAFICIHLKGDQIISGVAINILAVGITNFGYKVILSEVSPAEIPEIPSINEIISPVNDFLSDTRGWNFKNPPDEYGLEQIIQLIGNIFLDQSPIVYLALGIGILAHYVLFYTVYGLRIRAVGEHPRAADTVGINVYAVRYGAVILSGLLAGLSGVYLSLGFLSGTFAGGMSGGRGFIAIAAYIFGNWTVEGTAIASLLFGFFRALQEYLKIQQVFLMLPIFLPGIGWEEINLLASEFLDMIPYLLTIAVLARAVRKVRPPSAIGQPYEKE